MSVLDRLLSLLGLDFELELDGSAASFSTITPSLSLGARPRPEHVGLLRERGVTHVVSCLEEGEREAVAFLAEDFEALFLPLRDGVYEDIEAALPAFFGFTAGAQALVHCRVGVSRSATLAVAHVMQAERLRFFEAYLQVRARRPQVLPNVGFASALQRFERSVIPDPRPGPSSLARYLREVCCVPAEVEEIEDALAHHGHDAVEAIRAIFGEIPRVVQGVRR